MTGTLLTELGHLADQLQDLTGTLPPELGKLSNVEDLHVSLN